MEKYLYHVTTKEKADRILSQGLIPMLGENSVFAGEIAPAICLCKKEDLPYWMILFQRDIILRVNIEGIPMDDHIEYEDYEEWRTTEFIAPDRIKVAHIDLEKHTAMQNLCLGYLMDLSRVTLLCARYYEHKGYMSGKDLGEYLDSMIWVLNCLDYQSLDKKVIVEYLKKEGDSGEYMLTDRYKNSDKRLYSMLPCYPHDKLEEKRRELYGLIEEKLEGCLQVNTGGWGGMIKMKIVEMLNVDDIHDHRILYTLEIDSGIYVDVMHCVDTNLFYVMQEEDGTHVYGDSTTSDFLIKEAEETMNEKEILKILRCLKGEADGKIINCFGNGEGC